jgi:CBS domain-containing protein
VIRLAEPYSSFCFFSSFSSFGFLFQNFHIYLILWGHRYKSPNQNRNMLVKDVMTRNVVAVKRDTSLREAAEMMVDNHIGCLVVMSGGKVTGIITDRDMLVFIADEHHRNLGSYRVKDAIKDYVVTIRSTSPIEKAVKLMTENRIKKVPVVDDERLAGIITMSDIIWSQPRLIRELSQMGKKE